MAALPLGKLTILVGAGILGSVLAKEGRVSDVVSGAFKIAWKQIIRSDSTPAAKKPHNDHLMAQMNNLRKELEIIASSPRQPVTIITMGRTGTSKYGIIIVVVAAGYGYLWWKGWKLPDMMFATRRSLSDASNSVAKQLESLFTSISSTQRKLSSQLDRVECSLDESIENTARTQQEVITLQGRTDTISRDFKKVHHAVLTLETKINRIEGKQGETADGVWKLCDYALNMEKGRNAERIQASPSSFSRSVLELPPDSPSSLVTPLKSPRPALELPPTSPSRSFQENSGILEVVESSNRGEASNGIRAQEGTNKVASSSGWFGFGFPTFNSSALQRTRSATTGMVQQKRSTSQPL
ncbi:uncharacterized protein LOC103935110 isoform X1 [Pyrus x bretschneideri]|uniref:uncharacterized protein LOC103935110 isoform X1 n=1 Tax=Pyrus x bretschneideri TaxID=225117 RepID=UPI000510A0D9|nr:uncharacterized protein LOC103935110 isoform X1 [Pyrus x bretschneideri]